VTTSSDACIRGRKVVRTALLDALHSSSRDGPVNGLGGILDSLNGALASDGSSAEQANLADELLAEHGVGVGVCEDCDVVVGECMCKASRN
jgi:hypothetical protein